MRRTLHRRQFQVGSTPFWVLLWIAGMAAITYWCITQHLPALQAKIQTNAQAALDTTGAQNIGLTVDGRTATLTGQAESESQKTLFADKVSGADGIRTVNNLLSVNAQITTSNESTEGNAAIQQDQTTSVPTNTASNAANEVIQDAVTQDNESDTTDQQQSNDVSQVVEPVDVAPASQESNDSQTEPAPEAPAIETAPQVAAEQTEPSSSNEPYATSTDETQTAVSTDDIVQSVDEKALALVQQARISQAQSANVPVITGRPPTFNLRIGDGTLSLNGDMSSQDNMIEFVQLAMESLNASYVVNSVQTDENRQSATWLPAVTRFLPSMQNLENAEIDIIETQVTLSGVAKNAEDHDNVINDALGILAGLSVVERISIKEAEPVSSTDTSAAPVSSDQSADQSADDQRGTLRQETDALSGERILFQSGSDVLTADSLGSVAKIAELFSRYPNIEIEINGHTDSSGNADNNMRLSQLRANAVRDSLVEQGIDASRLSAYGFGDGVPIADNGTAAGRKLNRRIEFNF